MRSDWYEDEDFLPTGEDLQTSRRELKRALVRHASTRLPLSDIREYLAYRLNIPAMECHPEILNEKWCARARRVMAGLQPRDIRLGLRNARRT